MPLRRVVASLLLRNGRLVKGVRFADYRDAGDPRTTVRMLAAQGIDEITFLDIDAAREKRRPDIDRLADVATECNVPLTAGGGIVSADVAALCLERGADKVLVTTGALDRPDLIDELAARFGNQAVVVGIDIAAGGDGIRLFDHRGAEALAKPPWTAWLAESVGRGAGEVRLCSVDREGTRGGFDLAAYDAAAGLVDVPIVLEGGAGTLSHLDTAFAHGVEAIGLGTMLTFSDNNIFKNKEYLAARHHPVRRLGKA